MMLLDHRASGLGNKKVRVVVSVTMDAVIELCLPPFQPLSRETQVKVYLEMGVQVAALLL